MTAPFTWASADDLIDLPAQPDEVPFPAVTRAEGGEWPEGDPVGADVDRLGRELDRAFNPAPDTDPEDDLGLSLAVVVVQGGRIVAERYGPTAGVDETLISWSMAKSVTHALFGILMDKGLVDLGPTGLVQWSGPDDPRSTITVDQLLAMRSGLDWNEDYVDETVSHVIEMLFGAGQSDVAGYAIDRPAAHRPGEHYAYSSGTTNIVCRVIGDALDRAGLDTETFMRRELFDPIGMSSADPRFDQAGTFIGSSFLYATARDFARFGLLYLRDGCWDGHRILPAGWVDTARIAQGPEFESMTHHSRHWWVYPCPHGSFRASGYEGQAIVVVPGLDLVVVRLGKTPAVEGSTADPVFNHLAEIIACFEPGRSGR